MNNKQLVSSAIKEVGGVSAFIEGVEGGLRPENYLAALELGRTFRISL